MKFDLETRVVGSAARIVNKLTRRQETEEAKVPLVVGGKVDSPQVRPNVGKVATSAVKGLLDSLFKKKKAP
jgi:hypothetical protein